MPAAAVVEEMLEMVAHSGPAKDPFLSKLDGKHITKTLDIAEKRIDRDYELRKAAQSDESKRYQMTLVFLFGLAIIGVLVVWMFLHYGKTDQVFQLIAIVATGGGGIGIGTAITQRRRSRPDPLGSLSDRPRPPDE